MRVSSVGQARRTALSAFAGLALGAAGVTFERAGPSVLSASTADFGTWARAHHRELLAQSMFLGPSTLPMLLFFAGLRAHLEVRRPASGRVDLSLVVLAGGAAWAGVNLAAQAVQVEMALAARHGATDAQVAHLGDRMRGVLLVGNLPLTTALAAVGYLASRDRSLPGWLARLSLLTAIAHAAPVVTARVEKGPLSRDGALAYLPYPLFVAWVVGVAVTLLRGARHEPRGVLRAAPRVP
jgi:hypothetical protein